MNNLNEIKRYITNHLLLPIDNWALLYAQKLAIKNKVSLHITFCRLNKFLDCSLRHYKHIFQGKMCIIQIMFFNFN